MKKFFEISLWLTCESLQSWHIRLYGGVWSREEGFKVQFCGCQCIRRTTHRSYYESEVSELLFQIFISRLILIQLLILFSFPTNRLIRSTQSYIFPIHLSEDIIPAAVFYATVTPLLAWFVVKKVIIEPMNAEQKQRDIDRIKETNKKR